MAHPPNLLPLKLLVICLGLVLIGGMIFVFAAIAQKSGLAQARCPDVTFRLEGKGVLSSVVPQGDKAQIVVTLGGETKMLTVDRCTGTLQQTLTVAP